MKIKLNLGGTFLVTIFGTLPVAQNGTVWMPILVHS
jgi:hypothetical protein